jgi:hypothetical protein
VAGRPELQPNPDAIAQALWLGHVERSEGLTVIE